MSSVLMQPTAEKINLDKDGGEVVLISGAVAGTALSAILEAHAPATGIRIRSGVDAQISTAMNNDVLINTFGYLPVSIQLLGMSFKLICVDDYSSTSDIGQFFKSCNVHFNKDARVDVTIGTSVYSCALLAAEQQMGTGYGGGVNGSGAVGWAISLVGVQR